MKGGGHNVSGSAVHDGAVALDLSPMRQVRVDPVRQVVRAGGGVLLGDIDHETHAFGLVVPMGLVSATGIGGLSLQGGLGVMTRKHGLACDQLVAADVVTADGEILTVDETSHPD